MRIQKKRPKSKSAVNTLKAKLPPADSGFWRSWTVEELAVVQGVKPIASPEDLKGDFWPEDESSDDFLTWLRNLRRENKGED
jgi:hypothetical protein